MKLQVPHLNAELVLSQDWTAEITKEYRNQTLLGRHFGLEGQELWNKMQDVNKVTFPAGTVLTVKCIYIRQGASNYDSITFQAKKSKTNKVWGRFWVPLDNANQIQYDEGRFVAAQVVRKLKKASSA